MPLNGCIMTPAGKKSVLFPEERGDKRGLLGDSAGGLLISMKKSGEP